MIENNVVVEIQMLLREKRYSQRKIAFRLGVSRGTVNSIARGRRPDYSLRDTEKEAERRLIPPSGMPRRCPICGALVLMPCLACQIRATMKRQKNLLNYV